jgi:ABC-2 type transport system ATP-binding protein
MIRLSQIRKTYGDKPALKIVSFDIPEGGCFGLIGPNGAGKSTCMKILAGIIEEYEGEILFFGENGKTESKKVKKQIGYVPQDIVLNETLSAYDNLWFFGRINGLSKHEIDKRSAEILALVGLSERKHDPVRTFSGGMKRRINIGCALMHKPKFLIMDEPTVGVDPQSRNYIFDIIHQLKEEGTTILYSSHYMEEIEHLCDRIALIDKGDVVEHGKVDDILSKHAQSALYMEGDDVQMDWFEEVGSCKRHHNGILIKNNETLHAMEQVLMILKEKEASVNRLELLKPNLEDVFLKLTGTSLRD